MLHVSHQKVKKSGETLPEENAPFLGLTSKPPARFAPCANTLGPVFMLECLDTPYSYNVYVRGKSFLVCPAQRKVSERAAPSEW